VLGSTALRVSAIGFGAWGIGGRTAGATSYGSTDDAVSRRALEAAFDRGITFYDTANVYGDGHSEELIGETFRFRRDQIIIATKGGMLPSYVGTDFSPASLRTSLEGSLRRLRTDYVDILQLHNPGPNEIWTRPEIIETLQALRAEGKIAAFGFSTKTPDEALRLLSTAGLACMQVNLNLLDWRAVDNGLLEQAAKCGVGIIARTPLAFGFLSGELAADREFRLDDHRSLLGQRKVRAMAAAAQVLLGAAADDEAGTGVRAALRFCLSFTAVATAIPGMLTALEVEANAAAGDAEPFSLPHMNKLRSLYRRYEAELAA
jgi:aryl-alcohol dehydrogenase-like predicted oxidoreductase